MIIRYLRRIGFVMKPTRCLCLLFSSKNISFFFFTSLAKSVAAPPNPDAAARSDSVITAFRIIATFFFQRPYTIDPPAPCAASSLVMYFSSSLRLMDGVCAVSTGQGHHSRTCLHSSPPSRLVRYPAATFTHALHSPPSPVHPSGGIVKNQIGCVLSAVSVSIARQKENPNISSFPPRNELKAKRLQKLRKKQHSCNPHFLNY